MDVGGVGIGGGVAGRPDRLGVRGSGGGVFGIVGGIARVQRRRIAHRMEEET